MRKVLFVSFTSVEAFSGGIQCSRRNLQSLKALLGVQNVSEYIITPYQNKNRIWTKIERVRDIFLGYMGGLQKSKEREILKQIEKQGYTDVYVDSSLLGILAKKIKHRFPSIRVYTFFHNVEYDFVRDSVKVSKDYCRFYWLILALFNEKSACKYSDKVITLNERDAIGIEKKYGRKPDACIPITFQSSYSINENGRLEGNEKKEALFVGSYFYANVEGIRWFCENVLPKVNIHLTIVGAGMDKLQNEMRPNNKLSIYCNVPDLTPYYEKADFMVLPIFSGGGMKVKTAEALMYGKYILGTKEALTGYEITHEIAIQCDNSTDFIDAISSLKLSRKYNEASRKLFDIKYSFDVSLPLFETVLSIR